LAEVGPGGYPGRGWLSPSAAEVATVNPLAAIGLVLFGLFFVVLGGLAAGLIYVAYRKHRRYKLLGGTRMTAIAALRPGLVKTVGTVVAMEEPLLSPMTQRECVFYEFRVEEERTRVFQRRQRGMPAQKDWVTIVHDRQATRFAIEDGDAQAEIDLDGGEVTMQDVARTASHVCRSAPPELERVLRRRYGTSTRGLIFNKTLRYTETVIEEGDSLIALGEARPRMRERRHVIGKGAKVPLLVSDKGNKEMAAAYARSRNLYAIGAAVPLILLVPIFIMSALFVGIGLSAGAPQAGGGRGQGVGQQQEDPPPGVDFVVAQVADLRGGDAGKRAAASNRLKEAPKDEARRQEFEAARADPARRNEVAKLLVEQMNARDNPAHVRQAAMAALRKWATAGVVADLADAAERADDGEKVLLAQALGESKDPRAAAVLVKLLKGTPKPHARRALEGMGPEATGALVEGLEDEKADRETICYVLAKVGTAEALPAVKKLTGNPVRRLATAARAAVRQITARAKK
jgi:hypothetical protein